MGSLQTPLQDKAYCTLVTNDDYVVAAVVLAESLKKTGATLPRCVLITPENMSDKSIKRLQDAFDLVLPVSTVTGLSDANLWIIGRPDLQATMTKIQLWSLTQFRRILYLDADTLVISNLDHLFDLPDTIDFAAAPEIGFPDCFNSGVMLLRPDATTFSELTRFAQKVDSFDGGDQGLLNVFFGDGTRNHPSRMFLRKSISDSSRGGEDDDDHNSMNDRSDNNIMTGGGSAANERNWFRLSFTYNMEMHKVYRFYIPAALRYKDEHKILHFIGKDKPWHFDEGKVDIPDDAGAYHHFYADMVGKWWDTRRSVQTAL